MRPTRTAATDRGSMAVEVVVLVPALLLMMLLVVAIGRYVSAEGQAQAIARDAVRAATLERDAGTALAAARAVAAASTPPSMACAPVTIGGAFVAGGDISVDVTCTVSFSELGLIGLPGTADVAASSSAPLDRYRRAGA